MRRGPSSTFTTDMRRSPRRSQTDGSIRVLSRVLVGALTPMGDMGDAIERRRTTETAAEDQPGKQVRDGLVRTLDSQRPAELVRTGQDLVQSGAGIASVSRGNLLVAQFQRRDLGRVGDEVGDVPARDPFVERMLVVSTGVDEATADGYLGEFITPSDVGHDELSSEGSREEGERSIDRSVGTSSSGPGSSYLYPFSLLVALFYSRGTRGQSERA